MADARARRFGPLSPFARAAVSAPVQPALPIDADADGRRARRLRGEWSADLLGRHFLLTSEGLREGARRRGERNRLGFALTLALVRYLHSPFACARTRHEPFRAAATRAPACGRRPSAFRSL